MESLNLYLNILSLCYLFIRITNGHPQCLDFRPPFEVYDSLQFCTEYASYGCCTKERDIEIQTRYNSLIGRIENDNIQGCDVYVKDILCQECSPYAAHIYDAETNEERPFPGLCDSRCREFYAQCISVMQYISNNTQLLSNIYSADTFCNYISLPDVDYCYPELKTNDILNGDISREAITQDGCLCLEQFASGLRNPLIFESPKDGTGRIFIAEQVGVVHIYYKDGTYIDSPFMDLTQVVLTSSRRGDERGFLGLTFHPNFKNNRKFYVFFSTTEAYGSHGTRISEFLVSTSNPNQVDYTSERVLLDVRQPFSNHNGGAILFGDDGYLYLFLGDGGSGGDPRGYAQDRTSLLGKALRIDVDSTPDTGLHYKIPDDNPFVNEPNVPGEIYAYGIRNIWRCDVDEGDRQTGENKGRIICGDVGQSRFEEIDVIISGGNYGWNRREGFECYRTSPCDTTGEILPIYAYPHAVGKSVTGGHVYRGCMNPNLNGKYIYGDYVNGKIFTLEETQNGWENTQISMCGSDVCFNGLISDYPTNILSFGEDDDGEVYMLSTNYASTGSASGSVYKFVDPRRRGDPTTCRSYGGTTASPATTTTTTTTTPAPTTPTTTTSTTSTTTTTPTSTTFRDGDEEASNGCLMVDLSIALDTSGSVTRSGWEKMQEFSQNLLRTLDYSTNCVRVSMISFGTEGYLYSLLNEDVTIDEITRLISVMEFRDQWTNTGAAFALMTSDVYVPGNGDRDDAVDIAIVITDGPSNRRRETTVPNAQAVRSQGITIMTIGVGEYVDREELRQITNEPSLNVYVNNFDEILTPVFIDNIINQIEDIADFTDTGDGTTASTTTTTTEPPSAGFYWSCTFEDRNGQGTWCDTTQSTDGQFYWTITNEATPSWPTGPDFAYSGDYFVYIEATGKAPGDQALLELPPVPRGGRYCLSFAYHMFGWHIDTLFVSVGATWSNTLQTMWRQSGEKGNFWLTANIDVELFENEYIVFTGQRGGEYSGDIALDSIELESGIC